jgi:thymidylate synthase
MSKNAESIFKELEFFVRGQTDTKILEKQGVNIWKANTSREFLDSVGLTNNAEGDAGEIYGFQWRHFGAEYNGCDKDYTGKGYDQLANVVETIKKNPESRRLIVTAWNPSKLSNMCLPPCHMMYQFNCRTENDRPKLDLLLYQRSADLPLGVPFNIASYATLAHFVAELTGREAGELIYTTADTHVYEDQIYLAAAQINRKPYPFPELNFTNPEIKTIDDFRASDCQILNYQYWPLISYPFSL